MPIRRSAYSRKPLLTAAGITVAVAAITAGLAFMFTSETGGIAQVLVCRDRVVVLDLSSSYRSATNSDTATAIIDAAAESAAVCGTTLAVVGVAGQKATPILNPSDIAEFTPRGQSTRIRKDRFHQSDRDLLRARIESGLTRAFEAGPADTTTVVAFLRIAAELSDDQTDVILLTDGVNHDAMIDLNRPLQVGEGRSLAAQVTVPAVAARRVLMIGIGQVDSVTSPPGPLWAQEIRDFNEAICESTGVEICKIFTIAGTAQPYI